MHARGLSQWRLTECRSLPHLGAVTVNAGLRDNPLSCPRRRGTGKRRRGRNARHLDASFSTDIVDWVPAFAGMTARGSHANAAVRSRGSGMAETIGEYLIRRLSEAGVGHVFGVPGDYVL